MHACTSTHTKERMNGRDIGERGNERGRRKGDMVAVMYAIGPTGVHDGRLLVGYGMMAPGVIPRATWGEGIEVVAYNRRIPCVA